jgi:hypothetical protein
MKNMTNPWFASPVTSPDLAARYREVRVTAADGTPTTGGVRLQRGVDATVVLPGDESVHAWRPPV